MALPTFSGLPHEQSAHETPSLERTDLSNFQSKMISFPLTSIEQPSLSSMIPSACLDLDDQTPFSLGCSDQTDFPEHSEASTLCGDIGGSWGNDGLDATHTTAIGEGALSSCSFRDSKLADVFPAADGACLRRASPEYGSPAAPSNETGSASLSLLPTEEATTTPLRSNNTPGDVREPSIISQILRNQQPQLQDIGAPSDSSEDKEATIVADVQSERSLSSTEGLPRALKTHQMSKRREHLSTALRGDSFCLFKGSPGVQKSSKFLKSNPKLLTKMHECMKVLRVNQLRRMATAFQSMANQLESAGMNQVHYHCLRQSEEISQLGDLFSREMDYVQAKFEKGRSIENIFSLDPEDGYGL